MTFGVASPEILCYYEVNISYQRIGGERVTLGQKIKEARIERKMTQKEVVGDYITRNMLSKIENDSATPSVKTLEYLAGALGLPAGYFMSHTEGDELTPEAVDSARSTFRDKRYRNCLALLEELKIEESGYGDEVLLLKARASLFLAREILDSGKPEEAKGLVEDAVYYNGQSMYGDANFRAEAMLLSSKCQLETGSDFEAAIELYRNARRDTGQDEAYRLLMAEYYMAVGDGDAASYHMEKLENVSGSFAPEYLLLKGRMDIKNENYQNAAKQLRKAENLAADSGNSRLLSSLYAMLEECYRELEDYKMAYHYASKQLKNK